MLVSNEDRDEIRNESQAAIVNRLQSEGIRMNSILDITIQDANRAFPFLALDNQTRVYKENGVGGYTTEFGGSILTGFGTTEADYVSMSFAVGGIAVTLTEFQPVERLRPALATRSLIRSSDKREVVSLSQEIGEAWIC